MSKRKVPPNKLEPPRSVDLNNECFDEIISIFRLDRENDADCNKAITLFFAVQCIIDVHLFYQYLNQINPKQIRNYLEKKSGSKLVQQAEKLLKTLEKTPASVFFVLPLRRVKEDLKFLARPNDDPYPKVRLNNRLYPRMDLETDLQIIKLKGICNVRVKDLERSGLNDNLLKILTDLLKESFDEMIKILNDNEIKFRGGN